MSTETIMVLVLSLLPLLVLVAFVRSDQSMLPLRSFKISENVTYDCIDIYKQPGLDHPLLKNHTIQMKPSVSRQETSINITYPKGIGCLYGTVPILRNTKEYISNAQLFSEKNVHPLTRDRPGAHIAGVRSSKGPYRGVKACLEGYKLDVGKDQASYTQIYIGSGLNNQVNFIQAGFMTNPSVFGNEALWSYGFWMGKDGKGCYNTACPGFIQTSDIPIARPFYPFPEFPKPLFYSISQDPKTGNWWLKNDVNDANIGYWPKELFNLLSNGGDIVGVGGVVQASPSGPSPPMGNGYFPTKHDKDSAKFTDITVLNSNYKRSTMDSFPIEILIDSPNCYRLRKGENPFHINYGGPGGNSCGV